MSRQEWREWEMEPKTRSRTVSIGIQNFEDLMRHHYFYVDKTRFV